MFRVFVFLFSHFGMIAEMGEQENKKSLNMIAEMGEQENKVFLFSHFGYHA
jgi:hypothetical protein